MIEIIAGEKGKGKTKELLAKVNHSVATASGNIVYLDKSQKHMYELNNKVRLINVMDYPIFLHTKQLNLFLSFVSTFNSSIKTDRVKTTDTYQRIDNAGKP